MKPENRLADRFKVTSQDGPVASPAEFSARAGLERDHRRAETAALIARTFAPKPAAVPAASPAPITTPPRPMPPPVPVEPDARVAILERELSDLKAANELQLETQGQILDESRRTNEMLQISLQQNAQMIEAIARLASTSGRQNECILSSVGQAANALARLASMAEDRVRPARQIEALPAPAPTPEPMPEPEPEPAPVVAQKPAPAPAPVRQPLFRAPRARKSTGWGGLDQIRARREARRRPVLIAAE